MYEKHAAIHLIYGANSSGKSKMVRELIEKESGYLFTFNDYFSKDFVIKENVESIFRVLTNKDIKDLVNPSYSENLILLFCYELESILEMEAPYANLFIDGFPFETDSTILSNFLILFSYLISYGFNVTFTTCKKDIRNSCVTFFGTSSRFKLTEL